jgi:hypothetical protein
VSLGTRGALRQLLCGSAVLNTIAQSEWLASDLPCSISQANAVCSKLSDARQRGPLAHKVLSELNSAMCIPENGFSRAALCDSMLAWSLELRNALTARLVSLWSAGEAQAGTTGHRATGAEAPVEQRPNGKARTKAAPGDLPHDAQAPGALAHDAQAALGTGARLLGKRQSPTRLHRHSAGCDQQTGCTELPARPLQALRRASASTDHNCLAVPRASPFETKRPQWAECRSS